MDIRKEYIDSRIKNGIAAEYVDIDSLKLAPDNPRINEHVVEKVEKSIQSYGFAAPIVVQLDGTILAGHTRYKAAKNLNILKVPCRYMDISGDKAKLYRIADNKIGELAEWNIDLLNTELQQLSLDYNIELENMGFDPDDLDFSSGFIEFGDDEPEDFVNNTQNQPKNSTLITITILHDNPDYGDNKIQLLDMCNSMSLEYSISEK